MIAPLIPYTIKGVIWYQGESNVGRAYQYRRLFPAMIEDWRVRWGQGYFPFIYVQLANIGTPKPEPVEDEWAELREAQRMTLAWPNTGMAVAIDIGEAESVHPRNKQDVGKRLVLWARHLTYGEDSLVYSGPLYKDMRVEGNKIHLSFDHTGSGLTTPDDQPLKGFSMVGADKKCYWAEARIEENGVVWK